MTHIKKPQLAEDAILDKVIFPCWTQPKIDGVRAMNLTGRLVGRSFDEFKGFGISDYFSRPEFVGLDGEMTLGDVPNSPDRLCSMTTGAMGRFKDVTELADIHWWVFDYITTETANLPYLDRYYRAQARVETLRDPRVHMVMSLEAPYRDALNTYMRLYAEDGYEGTIIRNPRAPFKEGRATQKMQELWRVKPWDTAEILVTEIIEGNQNTNEAKKDNFGRTERSSAKAGLVPNGQVGSLKGILTQDYKCPVTGRVLFPKGLPCTMAPGEMTLKEATYYFENPSEIVGHVAKGKHLATGVKDVPRMFTYISHRLKEDISK